ncbi:MULTISPECIES: hypothetical protein [unclassified Rhizobium]|uniref:hypothetical protein n=1 Tax=unclassified Rhizobium TaxID=2613769 RepID=UPI00380E0774
MLTELIARYQNVKKTWEAQYDMDSRSAAVSPQWREYMALPDEILGYRCATQEEHIQKIELIEGDINLLEELGDCSDDRKALLFLASLKGGAFYGCMPVDNGEK